MHPYDQIKKEMQLLYDMGVRILFFCGGETFLWKDENHNLRNLVIEAKQMGFLIVNVVTNGTFPIDLPEANFTIEFSRSDRNAEESNGTINGITNGTINSSEESILSLLMENPRFTSSDLMIKANKSRRTINRTLASLKDKKIIERVGSNKTGYWKLHGK